MNQPDSHHLDSHYDILGVPPQAGPDQIRSRYRELARTCHPDVAGGQNHTAFQRLTQAYNVLQDPQQRAQYDLSMQSKSQPAAPVKPAARQARPPAAALRSPAMHRLLSEAEGDAFAEAGQRAEALACYRDAQGPNPNPMLEAKIARLDVAPGGAGGGTQSSAPARPGPPVEQDAQPFWRRWFGRDQPAGQS